LSTKSTSEGAEHVFKVERSVATEVVEFVDNFGNASQNESMGGFEFKILNWI